MGNKRVIAIAGFIVILVAVIFFVKILTIRNIVIVGNRNLTELQIRKAIGLKEGNSILYPPSKVIYERLKKLAWIKEAVIRKDLNGTLTVYVRESTAIAIALFNDRAYLIDSESQILEDFTEKLNNTKIFLPILKNIDPFKNREMLHAAVELVNFLNSKGYIKSENEIVINGSEPENLSVYLNSFHIIVGKGDYETKFAKYLIVNSEIQKRGIKVQYLDLRFPDRVIVKPVE